MAEETEIQSTKRRLVKELMETIEDPIHRRILTAYSPSTPVNSLELELQNILLEVMKSDDHKVSDN
jgi:hypothetical protein